MYTCYFNWSLQQLYEVQGRGGFALLNANKAFLIAFGTE